MKNLALILFLLLATTSAIASVNASYTYVEPTSSDPGQEVMRREVDFNFSYGLTHLSNSQNSYSAGLSLLDTRLDFDDANLRKVDLLKVKAPIAGSHVLNDHHILTWNFTPGLHGETDEFSKSHFRVEGQAMAIYGSGNLKGLYGAGFSDQLGRLQPFPLIGATWQASVKSNVTVMFPLIQYEYTTEMKNKYNFRIQPVGAQWTWQPSDVGGNDPGIILVKGVLLAAGSDFKITNDLRAFTSIGLVVNRRFEVTNQRDPSRHAGVDLKNAWSFQAGVMF